MRIYTNCLAAVTDIGRELQKCSSLVHTQTMQNKQVAEDESYCTREIEAFNFAIIDTSDRNKMPMVTLEWCYDEFDERISGFAFNPGAAYKLRPEVWDEFLVGEKFEYTYPERMSTQLDANLEELQKHPETRQAIIQIHNREIDQQRMGKMRVPCSMFYQFLKRDGKLDIIYVMRSSDFATHFQNDMWLAMELQQYYAKKLEIQTGKFIMFVSSLHIYKKDWEQLKRF